METLNARQSVPVACDLNAISDQEREAHVLTAQQLIAMAHGMRELANGIELQLPGDNNTLVDAVRFISHERECCPFFTFTLEAKTVSDPVMLRLTGAEGVKEFLLAEFGDKLGVSLGQHNIQPVQ